MPIMHVAYEALREEHLFGTELDRIHDHIMFAVKVLWTHKDFLTSGIHLDRKPALSRLPGLIKQ